MEQVHLPLWVEYVKALGAPIVALIAACIAGGIAYQQWRTARNKLKLDLFDKRLKVYKACSSLIQELHMPTRMEMKFYDDTMSEVSGAFWLFDKEVAEYIDTLMKRAWKALTKDAPDLEAMTNEQKFEFAKEHLVRSQTQIASDTSALQKLFAPYLKLEH